MGPFLDTHLVRQQVALDIEVELEYWRRCYRRMPFHRQGLAYESYIPAIKFAYDCYLYHHRDELTLVLPALKARYHRQFPSLKRTDWRTVERILKAVWQRIQSGSACMGSREIALRPPPADMTVRRARHAAHA